MRQHPIGTGPFKFVGFKPNEYIKVTRNPDYWKKGRRVCLIFLSRPAQMLDQKAPAVLIVGRKHGPVAVAQLS
jgi:ABC-type transport system substrate-binding protein